MLCVCVLILLYVLRCIYRPSLLLRLREASSSASSSAFWYLEKAREARAKLRAAGVAEAAAVATGGGI